MQHLICTASYNNVLWEAENHTNFENKEIQIQTDEMSCLRTGPRFSDSKTRALLLFFLFSQEVMLIDFRERGREREREGEKHRFERETLIGYLLYMSRPGTKPKT